LNTALIIIGVLVVLKIISSKGGLKKTEVLEHLKNGGKIIDVRSTMEFKSDHVAKAINIQHDNIVKGLKKYKLSKETPLILYCASGSRASVAKKNLINSGYTSVHNGGSMTKMKRVAP